MTEAEQDALIAKYRRIVRQYCLRESEDEQPKSPRQLEIQFNSFFMELLPEPEFMNALQDDESFFLRWKQAMKALKQIADIGTALFDFLGEQEQRSGRSLTEDEFVIAARAHGLTEKQIENLVRELFPKPSWYRP